MPALYLFATPFLLSRLGAEGFGVWTLLSVLVAIAGLADFGIGPATTLYVARYRGTKESETLFRVIQTAWGLYLILAILLAAALFLLGEPLLGWLGVPPRMLSLLAPSLPIFVLGVAMQFLFSALDGVVRGFERYDLSSLLRVVSGSANVITYCSIVALGGSLGGMITGQTVVFTVILLISSWTVCRLLHRSVWLLPWIHARSLKEFLNLSLYGWLQGLAGTLSSQADRLLVSVFLGPGVLAYYAACLQLAQLAHSILAQALAFTFPKFASLAADEPARLSLFNRGMSVATMLGTGISLILFIWAPFILDVWLRQDVPTEIATALRVLAVSNALTSTSILPSYLMFGMGHFRLAALTALASGLSIALGGYLLIAWAGVIGAAFSRLGGLPIALCSRVLVYQRAFGVLRWTLGFKQVAPVALAFLPAGLLLFVDSPTTASLLGLLLSVSGLGLGVFVSFTLTRSLYR
jgi:O-antigen/teichoic acid export membrane protein